jgi:hypothetical protein
VRGVGAIRAVGREELTSYVRSHVRRRADKPDLLTRVWLQRSLGGPHPLRLRVSAFVYDTHAAWETLKSIESVCVLIVTDATASVL